MQRLNKKGQDLSPVWSPTMLIILGAIVALILLVAMLTLSGKWDGLMGNGFLGGMFG